MSDDVLIICGSYHVRYTQKNELNSGIGEYTLIMDAERFKPNGSGKDITKLVNILNKSVYINTSIKNKGADILDMLEDEWEPTYNLIKQINEISGSSRRFIRLDMPKYNKLLELHEGLIEKKDPIAELNKLKPNWDNCFRYSRPNRTIIGKFDNSKITIDGKNIPLELEEKVNIYYPNDSRAAMCSEYFLLSDDDMMTLSLMSKKDTFTLKNGNKRLKLTVADKCGYVVAAIDKDNDNGPQAVFITHQKYAQESYDAFNWENKEIYKGWKKLKCKLV